MIFFAYIYLDEIGLSSSSPSPPPKRYSDLTLRKVRRHVLQLNQRWKSANTNIRHRLKILQRAQTVIHSFIEMFIISGFFFFLKAIEELRRKCDHLHTHLLDIELTHAQARTINPEQISLELEQSKVEQSR